MQIGTPLPRLDGKRDDNEYKPVWEQEVRDEQGRRRFHGAFTGGFSAGYYNSVGSKEGWTPSTFRSSRKDKEKTAGEGSTASRATVGQRPEDFMDEEDLEALREAGGALGSTQTYQMEDAQQQQRQLDRDPLMAMLGVAPAQRQSETTASIQVAQTSLGVRLLQRMGWRPGQGLGPRVSFAKRIKMLAMLGMPLSAEDKKDEEASKHLWPPPDTPMPAFSTKNDSKGLGWISEGQGDGLGAALRRARAEEEQNKKPVNQSGGFGLGALEVDSDGEDDVYASGTRIEDSTLNKRSAMQWNDATERVMLGKANGADERKSQPVKGSSSEKASSNDQNCWHDGRPMLPGFRIASSATLEEEHWFEAPEVPKGWTPNLQLIWNQAASKNEEYKSNMTSSERATILGEARLPGPPPSILNYLSQKDKERLEISKKAAAEIAAGKSGKVEATQEHSTQFDIREIPKLEVEVARLALQGYMPFTSEPDKQERYRRYLQSQVASQSNGAIQLKPSSTQSESQFIGELREFAKSASIFKPMSTVMASRFQSSNSSSSDIPQINPGLYIPERKPILSADAHMAKEALEKEEEAKKKLEEMGNLTSLQRNARLGLFGKETTREVKVWKPTRLLCKRFNVPQPYPDDERSEAADGIERRDNGKDDLEAAFGSSKITQMNLPKINARWEESKKQLQQLASIRASERESSEQDREEIPTKDASREHKIGHVDISNIGLGELQKDEMAESDVVKPSIDIFKAVFADDDDSDSDEDEDIAKEAATKGTLDQRHTASSDGAVRTNGSSDTPRQDSDVRDGSREKSDKLVFIPRKRTADDGASKKGSSDEKRKKKNKIKSLLTFSMDEDGVEEERGDKQRTKGIPTTAQNRPKAADLFN